MHTSNQDDSAFTSIQSPPVERESDGGGIPSSSSQQLRAALPPPATNRIDGVSARLGLRDKYSQPRGAYAWKYCCGLFCRWKVPSLPGCPTAGASSLAAETNASSQRIAALIVLGLLFNTQRMCVIKEVHGAHLSASGSTATGALGQRTSRMLQTIRKLAMIEPRHPMHDAANRVGGGPHSLNTSNGMSSNTLGSAPKISSEDFICFLPVDNVQLVDDTILVFEKYFPCVSLDQLLPAPRRAPRRTVGLSSSVNSGSATAVPFQPVLGFGSEVMPRKRVVSFVAISILRSVLRGLKKLHDNGMAHQHLRPSSVLVSSDLCVRLDNIEHLNTRSPLTDPELWVWYAPEVTPDDLRHGSTSIQDPVALLEKWKQCDVFAYGLLVYYLHTGKQPFDGLLKGNRHSSAEVAAATFLPKMLGYRSRWTDYETYGLDGLSEAAGGRHSELFALAKFCLRQSPSDRPTVAQLFEEIERIAALPDVPEPQQQSGTDSSSPQATEPPSASDHATYLPAMVSTSRTANTAVSSGSTYAAASKNVLSQTDPNAMASKTVQQDENETANWIADMCFRHSMQFKPIQQTGPSHNPLSSGYILGHTATRRTDVSNHTGALRQHWEVLVEYCLGKYTRKVTDQLVELALNDRFCERDGMASTFQDHSVAYRLACMDERKGMVVLWRQTNAGGSSDDEQSDDGICAAHELAKSKGASLHVDSDGSDYCGAFAVRMLRTFVIPCDPETSDGYDGRQAVRARRPATLLCARMGLVLCVCTSLVVLVVVLVVRLA